MKARSDSSQEYALFLPSAYDASRAWPVLFVLDPGGRGLFGVELFRETAEELGWVVASSYNSRSDVPGDRNTPALTSMLEDIQDHVRVDGRRLYLTGFSGTARASWLLGRMLAGNVAGVIGAGAALPDNMAMRTLPMMSDISFAFYGTAGWTDFNYEEMHRLDDALDGTSIPHQISFFNGGHSWMPAALASDALRWMELQAMRAGTRPVDREWVAGFLEDRVATARTMRNSGRLLEAYSLLDGTSHAVAGLTDAGPAEQVRDEIAASRPFRDAGKARDDEAREFQRYDDRVRPKLAELPSTRRPLSWEKTARDLDIEKLLKRVAGSDPADVLQARRLLNHVFAMVAFYQPQDALNAGDAELALTLLQVAAVIQPRQASVCLNTARAYAQLGNEASAMDALRCWVDIARPESAAPIESDPLLAPLRASEPYRALVAGLSGNGEPYM